MIKKIIILLAVILLLYVLVSLFLLDGKLTYTTSFCSENKIDSRQRGLFISDNLNIDSDKNNCKLRQVLDNNDIWIEKHYSVYYWGILFHWTSEIKDHRKIRFDKKDIYKFDNICCRLKINNKTIKDNFEFPIDQLTTKIGDKVMYDIYECQKDSLIGQIKITVDK